MKWRWTKRDIAGLLLNDLVSTSRLAEKGFKQIDRPFRIKDLRTKERKVLKNVLLDTSDCCQLSQQNTFAECDLEGQRKKINFSVAVAETLTEIETVEQLLCFMAMKQVSGFKLFTKDKLILKIGLFSTSSLAKKMFSFPHSVNLW